MSETHATPIPTEYVENAARAYFDAAGVHWDTLATEDHQAALRCMTAALEAFVADAAPDMIAAAMEAAREIGRREASEEVAKACEVRHDENLKRANGVPTPDMSAEAFIGLASGYGRAAQIARKIGEAKA